MYKKLRNTDAVVVNPPYPGHTLKTGSNSSEVARMQTYLNAIGTAYYPQLKKLTVDGVYGSSTKATVQQYQTIMGLQVDGIIGSNTWNSIVVEYNSIAGGGEFVWPGITLRPGSNSSDVAYMQTLLNAIQLLYNAINHQTVDGKYGSNMTQAVRLFQEQFGLSIDGLLGHKTWDRILYVFDNLNTSCRVAVTTPFPCILKIGSTGDFVRCTQAYLNTIRAKHSYKWPILKVDGIFGTATRNAVMAFQTQYGLTVDGVVGQNTWSREIKEYNIALSAKN